MSDDRTRWLLTWHYRFWRDDLNMAGKVLMAPWLPVFFLIGCWCVMVYWIVQRLVKEPL